MCDFSPTNGEIIKTEEILIQEEHFTCNECEYITTCPDTLEQHIQTHSEERYNCDVCSFKTKHAVFLIRHMKKHSLSEQYKCKMCNYRCEQESDWKTHQTIHKVNHQCTECSFHCEQLSNLELHAVTHTKPPESYNHYNIKDHNALSNDVIEDKFKYKEYECDVCNVKCFGKLDFYAHLKIHCVGEPFSCSLCDYMTIQRHDLNIHNSKVHFAYKLRQKKMFSCHFCDFKSVSGNGARHLKKHSKELPWACNKCEYRSYRKDHLTNHMRSMHIKHINSFKCKFCEYKTAFSNNLKNHIKTLHIGYFKCIICNHKTSTKNSLKMHTFKMHNRPFRKYKKVYINLKTICHLCKFNAKSVKSLHHHMMSHGKAFQYYKQKHLPLKTLKESQEDDVEKKFTCIICAYKCNYKYQLRNHIMMKHYKIKRHGCSLCGFRSSTKRYYQRHMALHEADTAIPLPSGYNAQNKYDLRYHVKTHKKDDLYGCDLCDFRCIIKSRLVEHTASNHVKPEDENEWAV